MNKLVSLLLTCLSAMLVSCSNHKVISREESAYFDSVVTAAEKRYDAGYKEEAMQLVRETHNRLTHLSVKDHFNYFTYLNIRYHRDQEYEKSVQIADSMLNLLVKEPESHEMDALRSVAYNTKADALFAMGLYNDAYHNYFLARKVASENNDSCSLRTYTYSLAMTLYRQQRYSEAAQQFKEAIAQSAGCEIGFNIFYFRQEILDNIGLCYNNLGMYDSAMVYYSNALKYLNENTGKYKHKQASVYEAPKAVVMGNMAEVYMHLHKYDSARSFYEQSIGINLQKGYTNTDAVTDQVKLAELYFKMNDLPAMSNILIAIQAELDTIPDKHVELMWNKLMWQLEEYRGDSVSAYKHLRAYVLQNDAYNKANKALMEADLDMRVRDLEKQYRINILVKDKAQQRIYLFVVTLIAILTLVIVVLVWSSARRSKRDLRQQQYLNDTINIQNEKLENTLLQLREKENDKTRILKSVAHDVMNPIAAIISLVDIMQHDAESLNEEQKEMLGLIREASTNSLNLSRDILEATGESNDKQARKEETDINELVAKSVELLNFRALAKGQQIAMHMPGYTIKAFVYKDKIRRVIHNLLANAIKFSYEKSKIEIGLEQIGNTVRIYVKDHGIGIPDRNKPYIFDMFTDAKTKGTGGEPTHGLGLSISKQIARAHGGDITFESEVGKGSTFYLDFPVRA